jgi:hypothetical protein
MDETTLNQTEAPVITQEEEPITEITVTKQDVPFWEKLLSPALAEMAREEASDIGPKETVRVLQRAANLLGARIITDGEPTLEVERGIVPSPTDRRIKEVAAARDVPRAGEASRVPRDQDLLGDTGGRPHQSGQYGSGSLVEYGRLPVEMGEETTSLL